MQEILISYNPDDLLINNADGEPIWPIFDWDDLQDFIDLCNFYNATPNITTQYQKKDTCCSGRTVMAIGEEYREEAALYAHLTGRLAIVVQNEADQYQFYELPAILIISYRQLSATLSNYLYQSGADTAPGLIIDYNNGKLRRQILFKSASLYLSKYDTNNTAIDFLGDFNYKYFERDNYIVAGKDTTQDINIVKELLNRKKALLNIVTHSDGIHAALGNWMLCQAGTSLAGENIRHPPLCVSNAFCYRYNESLEQVSKQHRLINASEIRSNILFWITCRGLRLLPSEVEPLWALAPGFIENPFIGAFVTSWKNIVTNFKMYRIFSGLLNKFSTVGATVAAFNNAESNKKNATILCIAGDPQMSFAANATMQREQLKIFETIEKRPALNKKRAMDINFLRNYLQLLLNHPKSLNQAAIRECLELMRHWEFATTSISSSAFLEKEMMIKIRRELVTLFAAQPEYSLIYYTPIIRKTVLLKEDSRCFVCGTCADAYMLHLNIPFIHNRIIVMCPNCGFVEDRIASFPKISLEIAGGYVRLKGNELIAANWDAQITYQYKIQKFTHSLPWPIDQSNKPVACMPMEKHLHKGPVFIQFYLMYETNFCMLKLPHRIE